MAKDVLVNGKHHSVRVLGRNGNTFQVEVDKKIVNVTIRDSVHGETTLIEINGNIFQIVLNRIRGTLQIWIGGKSFEVVCQPATEKGIAVEQETKSAILRSPATSSVVEKGAVIAPIAGRIVLLKTKAGHKVERGECVCVLEAMKMQNEVTAPRAGVMKEIRAFEGAIVNKGDVLALIA